MTTVARTAWHSADVADAVVIGAGPNGLVAANALVDAGWDVVLVEQSDRTGGAVRSDEVTAPGSSPTCSARSTRWRPPAR